MVETEEQLFINSLQLSSFRNYSHLQLSNIERLSIFVGENAIGKTSILEAIQLLTELKSFRANSVEQLIQWGSKACSIQALVINNSRSLEEKLVIQNNKREYSLNGKKKSIKELKGLIPAVTFIPDNLNLVKGSNSLRRDALDNIGSQISENFYTIRHDYIKILKQKNHALKNEESKTYIQSLNDVLAKVGSQYIVHRNILLQTFIPFLKQNYEAITENNEEITMTYTLSWENEIQDISLLLNKDQLLQSFKQALQNSFEEEYFSHKSKIGPHNDQFTFLIKQKQTSAVLNNAQLYASQGQQRSIVLAFKLAELQTIQQITSKKPVLLLDDVMSELDEKRRHMFINLISNDIQTFITTTSLDYFDHSLLHNATIYKLPL